MKRIAIALIISMAAISAIYGQGVGPGPTPDPADQPRFLVAPAGPPGTYNNPFIVHADNGQVATMGGFGLGDQSKWYYCDNWYNQIITPPNPYRYYVGVVPYVGQFLYRVTQYPVDYQLHLYKVIDSNTGEEFYFRIIHGHAPPPVNYVMQDAGDLAP